MAARRTAQSWNRGMVGESAPPREITSPHTCATPGCGVLADTVDPSDPTMHGWTRTEVLGSTEPPRWWCHGRCAGWGIALAELRTPPPEHPDGGER